MKIVVSENETVIYPLLSQEDQETDEDFCIVVGNTCNLINGYVVDDDDLFKFIKGVEKAIDIIRGAE